MFPKQDEVRDEHQEGQGGGNGEPQQQQAPPALTIDSIKSLLDGFQVNLLKSVDQKVNGINKEFKNQTSKLEGNFKTFEQQLATFRQREEEQQHASEEHQPEEDVVLEEVTPPAQAAKRQEPAANQRPAPKPGQSGYKPSLKEQLLERKLKEFEDKQAARDLDFKKKEEEANRRELDAYLRTEISKQKFNSERGPTDFFDLLRNKIVRGDDNAIYGPAGSTLEEFVKEEFEQRPFLHPAKPVNGSGAGVSSSTNNRGGFLMEDITPAMTADQEKAAWNAIRLARTEK